MHRNKPAQVALVCDFPWSLAFASEPRYHFTINLRQSPVQGSGEATAGSGYTPGMGLAQGIMTPERVAAMQRIADAEREARIACTREIDRICKLLDVNSEQEKSHNQVAPTVAECEATLPPQHDDGT